MSTRMLTTQIGTVPADRAQQANTTKTFAARLVTYLGVRRERRALHQLDLSLLEDIGITPGDARIEARRPAWDAPGRY